MFRAMFKTKYGDSVTSENPKMSAYKHIHWVYDNHMSDRHDIIYHLDGCVTVTMPRVQTVTFVPEELNINVD